MDAVSSTSSGGGTGVEGDLLASLACLRLDALRTSCSARIAGAKHKAEASTVVCRGPDLTESKPTSRGAHVVKVGVRGRRDASENRGLSDTRRVSPQWTVK